MQLVTFVVEHRVCLGAVLGDSILRLQEAYRSYLLPGRHPTWAANQAAAMIPDSMTTFLEGGAESLAAARLAMNHASKSDGAITSNSLWIPLNSVRLLAPIYDPPSIICMGRNYPDHVAEMRGGKPQEFPVFFAKFINTVRGPRDDIPKPEISDAFDYEAELAVVIGKRGRHITREKALDHVAGYMVANDITVRDFQMRTSQWLQGKTFDGTLPMGPYLVTADEVVPDNLQIKLSVNGEERQNANTRNLQFGVPEIISYISSIKTLEPGDVICTGTPGGVGYGRNPQTFLKDGDLVRVEIAGLGALENRIIDERKLQSTSVEVLAGH